MGVSHQHLHQGISLGPWGAYSYPQTPSCYCFWLGQRSMRPYFSCIIPCIHLSNSAETLPRAPITTRTIPAFLNFHNFLISFFKSWYFSTFSFSFSSTITSGGTAISIIIPFCSFLSITTGSGRLGSIRLSHWIFVSHSTLISSFSTAPSGACSYHFSLCCNPFFLQISQWTFFETLLCVAFCILFEPIFHIHLLCVAHFQLFSHIIYTGGFHWGDQCGTSCSLSWLPAPVHHTTMLLFQPLNHLLITITTFFPYQLSLSFPWWIVSAFVFHSTFLLVFLLCFLNSTVDIVSLILIVSAPDTPLIRFYY